MPRDMKFTGFSAGSAVAITASLHGSDPVDATVSSWGGSTTSDDTGITIVTDRSILRAAPDSVGLRVDLSDGGFATAAPASEDDYNPQFHDLYYYWDTGDQGTWTAPENVLAPWRSKKSAYGPFIRHMYTEPGTYTVGVTVVEPATGLIASTTMEVVVEDPDAIFAGANTICVSTDSADTFVGAPAGSQQFTDFAAAQTALDDLTSPGRLLFKRGQTIDHAWTMANVSTDVSFGAWGAGAKPIIAQPTGTPSTRFNFPSTYTEVNAARAVEARFADLNFVSDWNPIDGSGAGGAAVGTTGSISFMFSDVDFDGYGNPFVHNDAKVGGEVVQTPGFHYHFDNMDLTNYQSYAIITGMQLNARTSFTGCKMAQNALAPQALAGINGGGSLRQSFARELYIAGCDIFHNMGHGNTSFGNNPFTWSSNRLVDMAADDGAKMNINTSSFEGGAEVINFASVTAIPTKIANGLIQHCVLVGDDTTSYCAAVRYAGFTVRNNLMILPNTPMREHMNPARAFVFFAPRSGANTHNTDTDPQRDSPNKVYSNTFVGLRSNPANNNWGYLSVRDFQQVPGSIDENNILYRPNQTGGNGDAPLDTTTLLPWSPRNQGWRNGDTGQLDTAYALQPTELAFYLPSDGSAALGSATGVFARDDLRGVVRAVGRADKGAFQVTT